METNGYLWSSITAEMKLWFSLFSWIPVQFWFPQKEPQHKAMRPCLLGISLLLKSDAREDVNIPLYAWVPPQSRTNVKLASHVPKLKTDGGWHLSQESWKPTSLPTEARKKKRDPKMWCRKKNDWSRMSPREACPAQCDGAVFSKRSHKPEIWEQGQVTCNTLREMLLQPGV